jgi:secretion/DNA translocation related CpaE-like protein
VTAQLAPNARPLIVTADDALLDNVLPLAVAAGVAVDVAHDDASARRSWVAAPLVLICPDIVDRLLASPPPRRGRVFLVGSDEQLRDARLWQRAVAIGAEHVLSLSRDESWLVGELADTQETPGEPGSVIAVVGGRGGAGASVLSVGLALSGVRMPQQTFLIDGDPYGGGLDLVLGAEEQRGARWPDLARTRGRVSGRSLRDALPVVCGLSLLSWDREEPVELEVAAIRSVLDAAQRMAELVVVDLPRNFGSFGSEVLPRCAATLLIVPAEVRAVAAAARVAHAIGRHTATGRMVVRGPGPGRLDAASICTAVSLPLAGELADDTGLRRALERGAPAERMSRGPLGRLCDRIVGELATHRLAA